MSHYVLQPPLPTYGNFSSSPSRSALASSGSFNTAGRYVAAEGHRPRSFAASWAKPGDSALPSPLSASIMPGRIKPSAERSTAEPSPVAEKPKLKPKTPQMSPARSPMAPKTTPNWLIGSSPARLTSSDFERILPGRPKLMTIHELLERQKAGTKREAEDDEEGDGVAPRAIYHSPVKAEPTDELEPASSNPSQSAFAPSSQEYTPSNSPSKRQRLSEDEIYSPEIKHGGSGRLLPQEAREAMTAWLEDNLREPYPSEAWKRKIAKRYELTVTQINNWFLNARRRGRLGQLVQAAKEETD